VNNLLEYCVGKNTRLLYISSSEVYGKIQKNDPLLEDDYGYVDIDNVRNSYVESKRASEVLCRAYINEHEVNVLFARPGHVYGPTASIKDKRVSSDFAYKAAKGEKLELLSSGLQKRSYLYCVDAAMALLVCVTNGSIGEAYNIGSKEITTVRQMAEIYAKIGNCKLIVKNPNKNEIKNFNPMNNSTLNSSKLENLGYKECFTPIIGLSHTVEIIKDEYEL
jgi:nucleoside-diphosphate-sugar epimerase